MADFYGSFVAVITPFDSKGRIDSKAFRSLIRWHLEEGTDGIVCAGTTGEGCSLSSSERVKLLRICLEEAQGKMQVVAGTGVSDTRETVRLTEQAQKAGAHGALVVTPFYNRPTQEGCLAHFQEVSKVGLPLIVYHNPTRAGFRFTLDAVEKLGGIPNIAGFKDSGHDLEFVRAMKRFSPIPIIAGDDDITLEFLKEGAVGSISVIGNFIPKAWKEMIQYALQGNWESAQTIRDRFFPLIQANFLETNPQGIKFLVSQLGKCKPFWRLPMISPRLETQKKILEELIQLSLPFQSNIRLGK